LHENNRNYRLHKAQGENMKNGKDLVFDNDLKLVLEFMQDNIPVAKLTGVADALPQMARLLWSSYPQEPVIAASFFIAKECNPSPLPASECVPVLGNAGGGSVVAEGAQ
jgi:hypothetical protein